MKKFFAYLMLPVVGILSLVAFAGATTIIPNNGFLDPTDSGTTDNLQLVGAGTGQQDSFINVVRNAINWILGILALIALIIVLYGGFLMVTSAGDEEKYKKGFVILRHAAIGLILIGIAWFIVSIIFFVTSIVTQGGQGGAGTQA